MMTKTRFTISVGDDVASYLRSKPNASAVVAEAVRLYRTRELEIELESAYCSDADDSDRINRQWEAVDEAVSDDST